MSVARGNWAGLNGYQLATLWGVLQGDQGQEAKGAEGLGADSAVKLRGFANEILEISAPPHLKGRSRYRLHGLELRHARLPHPLLESGGLTFGDLTAPI